MALASLVLHCLPQNLEDVIKTLQILPHILEIRSIPPSALAATLELPVKDLLYELNKIKNLSQVLDLELVYINYEEDIDQEGFMDSAALEDFFKDKGKNL